MELYCLSSGGWKWEIKVCTRLVLSEDHEGESVPRLSGLLVVTSQSVASLCLSLHGILPVCLSLCTFSFL